MNTGFKISSFMGYLTTIIFLHYFYTYNYLLISLRKKGINAVNVISLEDIQFYLGRETFSIISVSAIGFLFIFIWHFSYRNEDEKLAQFKKSWIKASVSICLCFKRLNKKFLPKTRRDVEQLLLILILTIVCTLVLVVSSDVMTNLLFAVGIFAFPTTYILYKSKRKLVLYAYFSFLFLFAIFFVNFMFGDSSTQSSNLKMKKNTEISFLYKNDTIKTNQAYRLGFFGKKNIVLLDTAAGIIDYFDRDKISHIRFKEFYLEESKIDSLVSQPDSLGINQPK